MDAGVQQELRNIGLCVDPNALLIKVAGQRDSRATVYVYDHMKARGIELSTGACEALRSLEALRGKESRNIYDVPVKAGALAPDRRIHKVCKGPRLHERSEAAKEIMDRAIPWLRQQQQQNPVFNDLDRIKQAKALASDLGVPLETARGAITKLKQRGLMKA